MKSISNKIALSIIIVAVIITALIGTFTYLQAEKLVRKKQKTT